MSFSHLNFSVESSLFMSVLHILIGLFVLLKTNFLSSLYILEIRPLSNMGKEFFSKKERKEERKKERKRKEERKKIFASRLFILTQIFRKSIHLSFFKYSLFIFPSFPHIIFFSKDP